MDRPGKQFSVAVVTVDDSRVISANQVIHGELFARLVDSIVVEIDPHLSNIGCIVVQVFVLHPEVEGLGLCLSIRCHAV